MRRLALPVLVVFLVGLCLSGALGCVKKAAAPGDITTHTIVALLPLTGVLSTFGENSKETALLAAQDVNVWLAREGKAWRLDLKVEDDATDGPTALRKMQTWFGNGVKFFTGPQSSGAARECLAFANANKILFISQSSTSPALAIADDWLFRFCTDDFIQGPGIARAAYEAGARHLIFGWRGDTWGDGLYAAGESAAKKLGIQVYDKVLRYDPGLEDFPKEAALLNDYVQDLINKGVPKSQIGFVIVAFEEIAPFMAAADRYPLLKQIVWIGSDGTAMSEALMKHPVASKFAVDTKFINTLNAPGLSTYARFGYVRGHVFTVLGRETDAYSYNTYDMVWSLARAIDEVGYDSEKVKAILPRVADEWTKLHGASGHVVLNAAGDRAFADYDLWLLNEQVAWEKAGTYRGGTDSIDWYRPVY
ncbi:MAG: ABC transporter substrate-binding protein [bacterium]|nr:ABC transporter substrate-binding protein [bacterium]